MIKVLFVCLGNICRSPTADGVFRQAVVQRGLTEHIKVDSAGTAAYHVGNPPDHRSILAAKKRGYDLSFLRARQAVVEDFEEFDYVLAMDHENLLNLKAIKPSNFTGHLGLFLDFAEVSESEVPDPYYGGDQGFEDVYQMLERATRNLLDHIRDEHKI